MRTSIKNIILIPTILGTVLVLNPIQALAAPQYNDSSELVTTTEMNRQLEADLENRKRVSEEKKKAQELAKKEHQRLQKIYDDQEKYEKWLKQQQANKVSTAATTKNVTNGREVVMPANAGSFKSWMGYQSVTNRSTLNYYICQNSITDPNTGIRSKDGRYLVALGPKITPGVGYEVDIYLSSGKVIHALTGDAKAHTSDGIFQQGHGINSCVEFIVDQSKGSPIYKNGIAKMGGAGHLPQFNGYVTKFVVGRKVV